MDDNESVPSSPGGVDWSDLPGDRSVWETPPTERRPSDVRVAVADAHRDAAEVTTAEQSVEWTAIVEDLERDLADVTAAEPQTAAREVRDTPVRETSAELERFAAAPVELEVVRYPGVRALLTISLEPEWPGNVHVYEIMIDPRDGTFAGVALPSSNIPGETIRGAFDTGFTEINFTAVYPAPAYHYAWFGSGPLGSFVGSDSRGNALNTVSGSVTKPPADTYRPTDDQVAEDQSRDDWRTPVDEPPVARVVVEPVEDEVVEHEVVEDEVVEDEVVEDEVVEDEVVEDEVVEPAVEISVIAAETNAVVATELEAVPEPAPVAEPEASPAEDLSDHAEGCQCLPCRWAAFKPVAVTQGPLAGQAFYFGGPPPSPEEVTRSEPSAAVGSARHDAVAAPPKPRRRKRR